MTEPKDTAPTKVVFDFGGVLIDWNPRHLYRKLFADEAEMEHFLATVCTNEWNIEQDAGRPQAEALAERIALFPERKALIEAYFTRFDEMMRGAHQGTVDVLAELRGRGVPLYGLTNWSADTFPYALARFDFLQWFEGIVVSGQERMKKPDAAIYRLLIERYGIGAGEAVFIDDTPANVAAARDAGLHGIHFTEPAALRTELAALGLLDGHRR